MIKFFRKIRQKLLTENKFSKYLLYAIGEIVLVVIGILIALGINNWNEQQKIAEEETSMLKELKNSISQDIQQLNSLNMQGEEDIVSADILINWLDNKVIYNDTLANHFPIITRTGQSKIFRPQNSTFRVLESKGIDLISNDGLKNQILNLYNIEYSHLNFVYDNYRQNILDYGRPIARTKFKVKGELGNMEPNDNEELKTNSELYNVLKILKLSNNSINSIIKEVLESCKKIQISIDNEIEK
jgi:type II secretory pathway pseudopilin PulG